MASNASAACRVVLATARFSPPSVTLVGCPGVHTGIRREPEHLLGRVEGDLELVVTRREGAGVVDAAGQFRLLVERQERNTALDGVLQHRGEHERPVDLQRRLALLEGQPRGALVGLGDRRVRTRRGGHRLDDLQRLDRRRAMLGGVGQRDVLAVIGKNLSASTFQQCVEPDHQALVLLGLHGDPARLALGVQPGRLGHHAVPGVGRRGHQIGPVPKQLGVGGDRCGVQLVLPLGRLQRAGQRVGRSRRPRPGRSGRRTAEAPNRPRRTPRSTPRPAPSGRGCGRCRSAGAPAAAVGRRRPWADCAVRCGTGRRVPRCTAWPRR